MPMPTSTPDASDRLMLRPLAPSAVRGTAVDIVPPCARWRSPPVPGDDDPKPCAVAARHAAGVLAGLARGAGSGALPEEGMAIPGRVHERHLFGRLTRQALLRYYEELAPAILPHLRGRAFVSVFGARPGVHGRFVKDVPSGAPEWLRRAAIPAASRGGAPVMAPVVDDRAALLWLVQRGVVELHATLHRVDATTRPDQVLFDLDPTPHVRRADTAHVALLIRDALADLDLRACVKT